MARSRKPRPPNNPAPVAGPGKLSARTDGGPGQPVRNFPAQSHGQRGQLTDLQQAAPLSAGPGGGGGGGRPPGVPDPLLSQDVFGPTRNPNEPIQAGIPFGPGDNGQGMLPTDPNELLRALIRVKPSARLVALLSQE